MPTAPLTVLGPGRPSGSPNRLLAAVRLRQGTADWTPACALQLKDVQDLLVRVKKDEAPIACEQLPKCGG